MTRPAAVLRAAGRVVAGLAAAGLAAGCGPSAPADLADVPVDSSLVAALADVHLADARAGLGPDSLRPPGLTDSLRAVALAAHGLTADDLERALDRLAADPVTATATYDAVAAHLARIDAP